MRFSFSLSDLCEISRCCWRKPLCLLVCVFCGGFGRADNFTNDVLQAVRDLESQVAEIRDYLSSDQIAKLDEILQFYNRYLQGLLTSDVFGSAADAVLNEIGAMQSALTNLSVGVRIDEATVDLFHESPQPVFLTGDNIVSLDPQALSYFDNWRRQSEMRFGGGTVLLRDYNTLDHGDEFDIGIMSVSNNIHTESRSWDYSDTWESFYTAHFGRQSFQLDNINNNLLHIFAALTRDSSNDFSVVEKRLKSANAERDRLLSSYSDYEAMISRRYESIGNMATTFSSLIANNLSQLPRGTQMPSSLVISFLDVNGIPRQIETSLEDNNSLLAMIRASRYASLIILTVVQWLLLILVLYLFGRFVLFLRKFWMVGSTGNS